MHRGAIVGLGNVALKGHLPAWQRSSEFQIVAGLDSEVGQRELFSRALPEAVCANSFAELSEDLDFVDICTPPHTHFEIISDALERGWHVLCEKPLVLETSQLDRICQLAIEKERVVFTVHNWKFAPICRKIAHLVGSAAFGRIHHCDWQVLRNGPSITTDAGNWRLDPKKAGGGILVDHGWHAFYLVREWLGIEPCALRASLDNRKYSELKVEDTAIVNMKFSERGGFAPTARIFLTWASPVRRNLGTIEGSLARLTMEDDLLTLMHHDGRHESFRFESRLSNGSHHPDWFESVAEEFAGELNDVSRRGTNLRVARLCLRLIEQAKASSRVKQFLPV
jgi:predicted dehydrogenase